MRASWVLLRIGEDRRARPTSEWCEWRVVLVRSVGPAEGDSRGSGRRGSRRSPEQVCRPDADDHRHDGDHPADRSHRIHVAISDRRDRRRRPPQRITERVDLFAFADVFYNGERCGRCQPHQPGETQRERRRSTSDQIATFACARTADRDQTEHDSDRTKRSRTSQHAQRAERGKRRKQRRRPGRRRLRATSTRAS